MTTVTRYDQTAGHTSPAVDTVRFDRTEAERWARRLSEPGITGAVTMAAATDAPVRAVYYPHDREAEYYAALDRWTESRRRPAPYRAFEEATP